MRSPSLNGSGLIDALAVQDGAVLAAEVLHLPGVAVAGEGEVLARQTGVVGIAELIGAGPAEGDAIAIERHHHVLAIDVADYQFAGSHLRQEVSVTPWQPFISGYTLMKRMKTALFIALAIVAGSFAVFWFLEGDSISGRFFEGRSWAAGHSDRIWHEFSGHAGSRLVCHHQFAVQASQAGSGRADSGHDERRPCDADGL